MQDESPAGLSHEYNGVYIDMKCPDINTVMNRLPAIIGTNASPTP